LTHYHPSDATRKFTPLQSAFLLSVTSGDSDIMSFSARVMIGLSGEQHGSAYQTWVKYLQGNTSRSWRGKWHLMARIPWQMMILFLMPVVRVYYRVSLCPVVTIQNLQRNKPLLLDYKNPSVAFLFLTIRDQSDDKIE
jgi:hypothetical protein